MHEERLHGSRITGNVNPSEPALPADALHRLLRGRRSIRRYQARPIPREVLLRILETATWAPSAHNRQPWRFVVLTTADSKTRLADAMATRLAADLRADGVDEATIAADTGRSRQRLMGAATLVVVCLTMADMDTYPDLHRQAHEHTMAVQGAAMAGQNLLLAAHAEGLGGVWVCAPLFCANTVREALALPGDYEPQGAVALGYPAEKRTKTREPVETRVVFK